MIHPIGPPHESPRYPETSLGYELSEQWTHTAAFLWKQHFAAIRNAPSVYWSRVIGKRTLVHAKCFPWGIVVSQHHYRKVKRADRKRWMERVLLHELLHWAGYTHDARFKRAAKELGTW